MARRFRGQISSQRSEIEDENLDGCEAETNCRDIIGRKKRSSLVMEDEKHFRVLRGKKYHCDDCLTALGGAIRRTAVRIITFVAKT